MIKKLRLKLILVSMASLLAVLLLIIGSINVLNYINVISYADEILNVLEINDGKFPKMDGEFKSDVMKDNPAAEPDRGQDGENPRKDVFPGKGISPEVPYETRYFLVTLDGDGAVTATDTGKIAAIDADTAQEYARTVFDGGSERGFIRNYRYLKTTDGDNNCRIIFLDCDKSLSTFRSFLFSSCIVSLLGLAAVFLLIFLLSRRIVNPVSESYEKQKRFISDAGHEIKTPITIIDADAEVLEMDCGDNEWLKDIRYQTKRLASLTNDLIYLSRMEEQTAKQLSQQMIDFPLSDTVSETAHSFELLCKSQGKSFESSIRPMLSIHADERAIRQLVNILLDNAVKYSQEGGTVRVSLDTQGRYVRLTVYNTTEHIDKESLPHLFERFYRADKSRNSQIGGYGIGLSVAKAIVTSHKGKISATSADGESLTVTAIIPM